MLPQEALQQHYGRLVAVGRLMKLLVVGIQRLEIERQMIHGGAVVRPSRSRPVQG
ncbi:hypothetical protein [Noviherbaspirillum denitrificans]|uniref:hypothetical protein n=1 Tax=Noviherbaspirillum denitrificans TaxID=1968433 RepID=UPI00197F9F67|nr:hypothetical protein [Noviherbaspirillum denitrificans]